ncbi:hypothetical protein [Nocardioides marmoraquaticus]
MTSTTHQSMLPSTLSRLGRETDMLDTVISMMGDERLDADTAHGTPRREVVGQLADKGVALADAMYAALDQPAPDRGPNDGDERARFRASHRAFVEAAKQLGDLGPDAVVTYAGMDLRPHQVVPQRVAEVVLANEAVSSLWSLDEADPDSVRDALDALVRRLDFTDGVPGLTLTTVEGDDWTVHGGGRNVHGTRELLAGWLAYGEGADGMELPELPRWS